jgi:dephospho-CoA kinase
MRDGRERASKRRGQYHLGVKNRIPVIGIAGGIGAGKSSVAQVLAELGCIVSESDVLARAALLEPEIRDELVKWWGKGILNQDGKVDRSKVAAIVFADAAQRQKLEQLVHPWIEDRRIEHFAHSPQDAPAFVIDAPLFFEAGLDGECDAVIFVDTDPQTRFSRVATSRGWNWAELAKREQSQMPLDEKRRRADYVVVNNGDWSELQAQVRRILNQLVARQPE